MAYTIKFMHGAAYSAEDVNDVFSKLTTKGVSLFNYTSDILADLDDAVSAVVQGGMEYSPDELRLIKTDDDKYKVLPGTAFMHDGSMITVDADGVVLNGIVEGAVNYVYIKRRAAYNDIIFEVSDTTWTDEDVPVAVVDEFGSIADSRMYAKSQVIPGSKGFYIEMQIWGVSGTQIETGWNDFKYVLEVSDTSSHRIWMDLSDGQTGIFSGGERIKKVGSKLQLSDGISSMYPKSIILI